MRNRFWSRVAGLFAGMLVSAGVCQAQCAGRWLPGSGVAGVDGRASAFLRLDEHRVLVGGSFATAGSTPAKSLAIYDRDTGIFAAVPSFEFGDRYAAVNCIHRLEDGQLLLGTNIDRGYSAPPYGLVRLDTVNDLSTPVTLAEGDVAWAGVTRSISPLGGGRLLMTGLYYIPNGQFQAPAGIYDPNSGQWTPLPAEQWISVYGESVGAVLANGDVVVGVSDLPNSNTVLRGGVLRWDPQAQRWLPLDGGIGDADGNDTYVNALLTLPGGDLLSGGVFTTAGSLQVRGLARYSPASGHWTEMPQLWQSGFVSSMVSLGGPEVLFGGFFELGDGTKASALRANLETGKVTPAGLAMASRSYFSPQFGVISDGTVFAGFNGLADQTLTAQGVAMWTPEGNEWRALTDGDSGAPGTLSPLADGSVVVTGDFARVGGVDARNVALYEPSTGRFTAVSNALISDVGRFRQLPDGRLVGFFGGATEALGQVGAGAVILNPATRETSLIPGPEDYGAVARALPLPNGDLFAALERTSGSRPQHRLARYQTQTSTWAMLDVSLPSFTEINPYLDGKVILYGTNLNQDGVFEARVSLLDPQSGATTPIYASTQDWLFSARALPDGDIVSGGYFRSMGLASDYRWVRFHPALGTWDVLSLPEGVFGWQLSDVEGEAANGDLFFLVSDGGNYRRAPLGVYRYQWQTNTWARVGGTVSGVGSGSTFSVAELPGGDLAVVGPFVRAGDQIASGFARWTNLCSDPCDPDINRDGNADSDDVAALIDVIAGGLSTLRINPDFNHDGNADQTDIDALVNVVAGGECP